MPYCEGNCNTCVNSDICVSNETYIDDYENDYCPNCRTIKPADQSGTCTECGHNDWNWV